MSGVKFDKGKPRMSLLPFRALREVAYVLTDGAAKYGDHNWRGGMEWSKLADALLRHYTDWQAGQDRDTESGRAQLAHMACNILFLMEYEMDHPELDDRFKRRRGSGDGGAPAQAIPSVSTAAAEARAP